MQHGILSLYIQYNTIQRKYMILLEKVGTPEFTGLQNWQPRKNAANFYQVSTLPIFGHGISLRKQILRWIKIESGHTLFCFCNTFHNICPLHPL